MHVSASFTDHREAERSVKELGDRGIPAEIEPLADVDPPLADPVLVRAHPDDVERARVAVESLVHHGGAVLTDPVASPTWFDLDALDAD